MSRPPPFARLACLLLVLLGTACGDDGVEPPTSARDPDMEGSPVTRDDAGPRPMRDAGDPAWTPRDAGTTGAETMDASIDAGEGGDAGRDAGFPVCAERGESCEAASCCAGSLCVRDQETERPRCVEPCAAPDRCEGCDDYCRATPMRNLSLSRSSCDRLVLVAEDGTFLGEATSSGTSDSVCGSGGRYASTFYSDSIHNKSGTYGNNFSAQSAYNSSARTPPALVCTAVQGIVAFVTKSSFVTGAERVDPDLLCDWLRRHGR